MSLPLPALLILAVVASPAAGAEPRLVARGGELVLATLPDVLADEEVRPHLTKGLTTTVVLRVEIREAASREKRVGGARLELRYDLWDEVFLARVSGSNGRRVAATLEGFDELAEWWAGLEVPVLPAGASGAGDEARVEILVIPFSETEKNDAQRWFSRSLQRADRRAGAERLDNPPNDATRTLSRTFHLLMAASIQRQALASFRFTVPVLSDPEERP